MRETDRGHTGNHSMKGSHQQGLPTLKAMVDKGAQGNEDTVQETRQGIK